jgi:hypothetical protein
MRRRGSLHFTAPESGTVMLHPRCANVSRLFDRDRSPLTQAGSSSIITVGAVELRGEIRPARMGSDAIRARA